MSNVVVEDPLVAFKPKFPNSKSNHAREFHTENMFEKRIQNVERFC